MNETSPSAPNEQPPGLGSDLRELRRSRSNRVVAGVLGGLADRLGVDPLVLRIVTAVLALFGGVGVVIYALAWLLIPDQDADGSVAEHALGRRGESSPDGAAAALAIGLVIVAMIAAGGAFGSGVGSVLLVLAVLGGIALLRRRDEDDDGEPEPAPGPPDQGGQVDETTYAGYVAPAAEPVPYVSGPAGTGWPEGPDWSPSAEPAPAYEAPVATLEPEPKPPRSWLGPLTVSAAVVAMGILAINEATWASVPVSAYVATALAVVGLGLLAGTWFGRSRGLIVLGLVLAIALPPAMLVADNLRFTADHTTVEAVSATDLPAGPVQHGTGTVTYDLSSLQLRPAEEVDLTVNQSIGELRVLLPEDACVEATASAGLGELVVLDGLSAGMQPERTAMDNCGPADDSVGTVRLALDIGLGRIEVTR